MFNQRIGIHGKARRFHVRSLPPLEPGYYQAIIHGEIAADAGSPTIFDIVHSSGENLLAKKTRIKPETTGNDGIVASMEFFLDTEVMDLEIRATIGNNSNVTITNYEILRIPGDYNLTDKPITAIPSIERM